MSLSRSVRLNAGIFFFPAVLLVAACGGSGSSGNATGDDGTDGGGGGADSSGGGSDGSGGSDSGGTTADGGTTSDGGTTNHDGGQPGTDGSTGSEGGMPTGHAIKTVFVILMENNDWSNIKGNSSAPYINGLITTTAAHAENYHQPTSLHPSEPNYIWLEAANNFGKGGSDGDPSTSNSISTTLAATHLVDQLEGANVSWKSYVEGISGTDCPIVSSDVSSGLYAAKHVPTLFFQDVTNTNSKTAPRCIAHVRPYTELATDIAANTVPQYNFITPNLCNDMHGASGCPSDEINAGDSWLSTEVPKIMASSAYTDGGVIFIVWDEGELNGIQDDNPIGMIVLSPLAKPGQYSNMTRYDHSSMVKTNEEIFGVPPIQHAADATTTDLSDFFTTFP